MLNKFKLLIVFLGLPLGILSGVIILLMFSYAPLSVESPVYKILGINKTRVIGFQPYWLLDKADKEYSPYITTLSYFGLVIDSDGTIQKLVKPTEEEPGWTTLRSEKFDKKYSSLLVHNGDEASISALLKNPSLHAKNLVTDIKPIMQKYGFSNLNLDIESFQESSPSAQKQFTLFLEEVKNGLNENKLGTITVEISPSTLVKDYLIKPEDVGRIADYIVIMAYDYHYAGSYISGPVAPIGGAGKIREFDVETALKEAIKIIPSKKIVLGIPLYGYEWETLSDKPGAATIPTSGATASNRRAAKLLSECQNCTKSIDESAQEPYVIFPDPKGKYFHQIFYTDKKSLSKKLDLAKKYKIAGVALWALGYEGENLLEPLGQFKKTTNLLPLSTKTF